MQPGNNPIERYKAERDGLDILGEIEELAASHGGWETIAPRDRERLKWIGTFFRKTTPGRFMMRIRITGGQTTAAQLRALAVIGERLGDGVLDLTTRQQIELRRIEIRDVPQIMDALEGADLSSLQTGMDNIRGVTCCPLAGVAPHELFDASPAGAEYTRIFVGNREFTNLPRKFNVAITGCLENCTQTESQDVGMTPATRTSDGQHGFNVVVGGKMGSGGMVVAQPLDVFVEPHEAAALAAELTLLFRDEGSRDQRTKNRLAFLVQDWGLDRFRDVIERRWGRPLAHAQEDARQPGETDHLGVQRQAQSGLYSVGLCVPTGRVNSTQLAEAARGGDGRRRAKRRAAAHALVRMPRRLRQPPGCRHRVPGGEGARGRPDRRRGERVRWRASGRRLASGRENYGVGPGGYAAGADARAPEEPGYVEEDP